MSDHRGHVEPGGPASSRMVEIDGERVEVRKLSVGPMDNNCYVLRDVASDAALLIDPANDADRIMREIDGLHVETIFVTHGHRDHWQALDAVADGTGAAVVYHPDDADLIPRPADDAAADGDVVVFGGARARLIHTPGHTPGSTCVLLGDAHLFSGDTLFPGGFGRTTSAEAFDQIYRSATTRLFDVLGDDTHVYPGHGDDTTIGAERPHLPEWRERGW